jgi:hypothetical protein
VARTIPMPSREDLPDGPRREFVTELRRYYRPARPSLREISRAIEKHPDPRVREITASAETVRRMITGKVLSVDRDRVYAVFRALCELAEIDPDAPRDDDRGGWDSRYEPPPETNWQCVQRLWDAALEEEADAPPLPRPAPPPAPEPAPRARRANEDPWANDTNSGYTDEPPF